MRNLLRSPLTWMVIAEFVVVGALIVVVWNVVGATRPAFASPSLALPASNGDTSSPLPDLPVTGVPGPHGPLPGLNLDSAFWRLRLEQLNRDQVVFEKLEWRIIHNAMGAMQRYLETVVLPAIKEAEKARGGLVP
jgi:hypothetical protein